MDPVPRRVDTDGIAASTDDGAKAINKAARASRRFIFRSFGRATPRRGQLVLYHDGYNTVTFRRRRSQAQVAARQIRCASSNRWSLLMAAQTARRIRSAPFAKAVTPMLLTVLAIPSTPRAWTIRGANSRDKRLRERLRLAVKPADRGQRHKGQLRDAALRSAALRLKKTAVVARSTLRFRIA